MLISQNNRGKCVNSKKIKMQIVGYSSTPLIKKLGITENISVLLMNQPTDYFKLIEKDITVQFCKKNCKADFIHVFVRSIKEFETTFKKIKKCIKPTSIIWVSSYKKSSGISSDISENDIRNYALKNDLVNV